MLNSLVGIIASSGGAAGGGAYESIASVNGTGSSDTITFSSIPSGYTSLQLRFNAIGSGGGSIYRLRFNGDSGTNYANHLIEGAGAAGIFPAGSAHAVSMFLQQGGGSGTYPTVGIVDIHNYASTTQYKTARMVAGKDTNDTLGWVDLGSGLWRNTAAVTSISIIQLSYNFASTSTFSLYGIKGA
jgi:hypothetical protein